MQARRIAGAARSGARLKRGIYLNIAQLWRGLRRLAPGQRREADEDLAYLPSERARIPGGGFRGLRRRHVGNGDRQRRALSADDIDDELARIVRRLSLRLRSLADRGRAEEQGGEGREDGGKSHAHVP